MNIKEQLDIAQGSIQKANFVDAIIQLESIYNNLTAPPPRIFTLLARAYQGMSREDDRVSILKASVAKWPNNLTCRAHLALAYNDSGKPGRALCLLKNVPARDLPLLGVRALSIAFLLLNQAEKSVDTLLSSPTSLPPHLTHHAAVSASSLFLEGGPTKEKDKLWKLKNKCTNGDKFLDIFCNRVIQHVEQQRDYTYDCSFLWPLDFLMQQPKSFCLSHRQRLQCAQMFFTCKNYDKANQLIRGVKFTNQDEEQKRKWLLALLGTKTSDFTKVVDNLIPDEILEQGSLLHFKYGNEKCLIWFAGVQPLNTARIFTSVVPVLKARKISLLIVQDNKRMMSLAGFGPFPDRETSIKGLGNALSTLGYTKHVTSAVSGSGLSAIIYGCRLNVEGIYGINALTQLPEDEPGVNKQALHHRKRIFKHVEMPPLDSRDYIRSVPSTKVFLNYSKHSDFDMKNVEQVSDLPNVITWPENYSKHSLFQWLQEDNMLTTKVTLFFDTLLWL